MLMDSINNYYEQLVHDRIMETLAKDREMAPDQDFLEDVACVALNNLPARYVRHSVDLVFYMSAGEVEETHHAVKEAVDKAIKLVRKYKEGPKR